MNQRSEKFCASERAAYMLTDITTTTRNISNQGRRLSAYNLLETKFASRNDVPLNLARAFVNLGDLRVAEVSLHGQLFAVAHAAVNLHGLMRHIHGGFGCE